MRRQRSISFYAETEEEFIQEYDRRKSISERRRCRARSYGGDNEENLDTQKNNDYSHNKKKYFQSYDDLELDQLGVNSTFQITTIDKEEPEENEGGLIQKIKNINISFKQNNNNSFFTNLAPFTKNIIGPLHSNIKQKEDVGLNIAKNNRCNNNKIISEDKSKKINKNNNKLEDNNNDIDEDDDYKNLLGTGCGSYQMRYIGLNEQTEDLDNRKRKRSSVIENPTQDENISFLDNININELNKYNNLFLEDNDVNDNNYDSNYQINDANEEDSPNKNISSENYSLSFNINNSENKNNKIDKNKNKNNINNNEDDEKKERRYTFDINTFIPDNNYLKEGEENESPNPSQKETLQNFICKNEFLSKNIDFVDEHLKFLITGSDIKTKHLFLNQLLNEKTHNDDSIGESFNICKKVIKLLGDYIKLELYEEDCSLCYSHMLNTYVDLSDGVILIINMDIPTSAKYIYDIIDKLKYKLNKDKRHFNVILLCFELIIIENPKDIDNNNLQNNHINSDSINESKKIINDITNEFEIKPNYITFYLNDKDDCLKNDKFELVINKFLSLAYLKKERKKKCSSKNKNNIKKHKRGITGI
jgi:hypothetical protein